MMKFVLRKLLVVPVGEEVLAGEPLCDLFFAFALNIAFSAIAPVKSHKQVGSVYRVIIAPHAQIVLIYKALQTCAVRLQIAVRELRGGEKVRLLVRPFNVVEVTGVAWSGL